jgi:hypothetical protein
MNSETTKILHRHLYWISIGLTFEDILAFRKPLWDSFSQTSTMDIQMYIMANNQDLTVDMDEFAPIDFSKITYLYIDDENFDGDIEFVAQCKNIIHIHLDGCNFQTKIKTVGHLSKLHQLEFLNVAHNEINNLEQLSVLHNLHHLWFFGNNIDSIKAIITLKKLQELKCTIATHEEVYRLLQSSIDCDVEYKIMKVELPYRTTRVDDLFFKYIRHESFEPPGEYVDVSYCFSLLPEQANGNIGNPKIENELFEKTNYMVNEYIHSLNVTYQQVLEVIHSSSLLKNGQRTFNYKLLILKEEN